MLEKTKRRKDTYNPYQLYVSTDKKKFFIRFKDGENTIKYIEINDTIYYEFNKFELDDKSQMNKYDRHIEHSQVTEITLNKRAIQQEISVEETVMSNYEKEKIHNAILKLPEIQKRRIKMYFFDELTQKEIANKEGTSIRAIQYSMKIALKNLKKFLNHTS